MPDQVDPGWVDPGCWVVTTGAGPPVLLVGTTVASWDDAFCARLTGHQVVRYDLRDTGRAAVVDPGAPAYTLRDLVADAAGLLPGPAHVVGLGVGGWIAQLLALDHPGSVATLTLIATRPTPPGPSDPDLPEHADDVMAHLVHATEPDWTDRTAVLDHMTEHARHMAGRGGFDEDDTRGRAGRVFDRAAGRGAAVQRASQSATVFAALDCRPRWRERLGAITAPTLVVHGAHDPFFPLGNGEALAREIPGAELLVLPDTGAGLPGHTHERVATAIVQHIGRSTVSAAGRT